ncbi:hypothetical protein Dsin_009351 [Dipteronia sinensis]|uniref:Uncharacterized protein n=1 Tax=Dipteronia sinensis TaxID=43782 RepID=A0AAE0AQE2_9ROSI|nr:hypothetical protein Dsin_009351 [Dipteronia sinensis]
MGGGPKLASSFVKVVGGLFSIDSISAKVIKNGMNVMTGNGERANFWNDIKWDSFPLRISFPKIFDLELKKKALIQEFERREETNWVWNVKFGKSLFDWEMQQWKCFLLSLGCIKFSSSELEVTKLSVSLSYMVFVFVYRVDFYIFCESFIDFHVREGFLVCNMKTDSKSEFGDLNTVERREECTREEGVPCTPSLWRLVASTGRSAL